MAWRKRQSIVLTYYNETENTDVNLSNIKWKCHLFYNVSVAYFGMSKFQGFFFIPPSCHYKQLEALHITANLQTLTTQFTGRLTPGSHSARTPSEMTVEDIDAAAETPSEHVRSLSPHFSIQDMTV